MPNETIVIDDVGTAPQATITMSSPGPVPIPVLVNANATTNPFAPGRYSLLDYARMVGTPVGKTGALVGSLICTDEICHRGTILTVAAAVAYYGWTRRDLLGYGLMASAAGAAIYTLFDAPRVVPGE